MELLLEADGLRLYGSSRVMAGTTVEVVVEVAPGAPPPAPGEELAVAVLIDSGWSRAAEFIPEHERWEGRARAAASTPLGMIDERRWLGRVEIPADAPSTFWAPQGWASVAFVLLRAGDPIAERNVTSMAAGGVPVRTAAPATGNEHLSVALATTDFIVGEPLVGMVQLARSVAGDAEVQLCPYRVLWRRDEQGTWPHRLRLPLAQTLNIDGDERGVALPFVIPVGDELQPSWATPALALTWTVSAVLIGEGASRVHVPVRVLGVSGVAPVTAVADPAVVTAFDAAATAQAWDAEAPPVVGQGPPMWPRLRGALRHADVTLAYQRTLAATTLVATVTIATTTSIVVDGEAAAWAIVDPDPARSALLAPLAELARPLGGRPAVDGTTLTFVRRGHVDAAVVGAAASALADVATLLARVLGDGGAVRGPYR